MGGKALTGLGAVRNPCAIRWGQLLVELLKLSDSPESFISRLFARDARRFQAAEGPLSWRYQQLYLGRGVEGPLRWETWAALSRQSQEVYAAWHPLLRVD